MIDSTVFVHLRLVCVTSIMATKRPAADFFRGVSLPHTNRHMFLALLLLHDAPGPLLVWKGTSLVGL